MLLCDFLYQWELIFLSTKIQYTTLDFENDLHETIVYEMNCLLLEEKNESEYKKVEIRK